MEEVASAFKFVEDKPTGKRPLGKPRRRWGQYLCESENCFNMRSMINSAQDGIIADHL